MRYNNAVISSASDFAKFWANLATVFKGNSHVVFDIMNEPYGIDAQTVFTIEQVRPGAVAFIHDH
jgi:endoglucanase